MPIPYGFKDFVHIFLLGKETQTFPSALLRNSTGESIREKKLCFECLKQIVTLRGREIDSGHDHFPAGKAVCRLTVDKAVWPWLPNESKTLAALFVCSVPDEFRRPLEPKSKPF